MKQSLRILGAVLLIMSLFCNASAGDSTLLKDWSIDLENTARIEYYNFDGDPAGSPYTAINEQFYDELSAQFSRDYSPYEFVLGRFNLLYNDSAYRRNENGVILERASLIWEKGDKTVPFRIEGGDHYAFLSTRTMQRSLKGGRFEIQPLSGSTDRRHSLVFFLGTEDDTYRNLKMEDDFYTGGSWLMEDEGIGNYSLNLVRNSRNSDEDLGLPERNQTIASITGNKVLELNRQKLSFDGEIARFMGDHDATGSTVRENVSGMGYFGQVRGETGTPLSYLLRFEDYDKDYVPAGGGINSDYRVYNTQAGWRFKQGLNLRGRFQHYTDGVDSANPLKTTVAGANLSGPLVIAALPQLSTNFDAFIQEAHDRDKTTDYFDSVARLNLGLPVMTWAAQMLIGAKRHHDQRPDGNPNQYTYDLGLSAARALVLGVWKGSVTPGITLQKCKGNDTDQYSYGPNIAIQLAANAHNLGMDYHLLRNDSRVAGQDDLFTHSLGMNYRYIIGPHTLGLEAFYDGRRPNPGESTEAYRVGAFYTLRIGKPAGISLPDAARSLVSSGITGATDAEEILLADPMYIGKDIVTVMNELASQGIAGGMAMPGMVVYEVRLLEEIFQRQRFALLTEDERVTGSVLVVDFDDVGDHRSMSQIFDEVVSAAVKRLGRPIDTYSKGDFSANLAQDIKRGDFVRIFEWKTKGGMIRLGIPQRLDGKIRIELQFRKAFPSQNDTYWSIETLQ